MWGGDRERFDPIHRPESSTNKALVIAVRRIKDRGNLLHAKLALTEAWHELGERKVKNK